MPTDKPRFTITVDDELFNQITEYRFSNRMKNQTQAVLSLIEKGLLALSDGQVTDFSSSAEEDHVKKYRGLDDHGKKLVDAVLDIEYERCSEAVSRKEGREVSGDEGTVLVAARNGQRQRAKAISPDVLDSLIKPPTKPRDI